MPQLLFADQRTFEGTGSLSWAVVGGTLSRDTGAPLKEAKSLKLTSSVNGLAYMYPTASPGGLDALAIPTGPARKFRAGMWFKGPAGRAMQLWVRRYDPGLGTWTDTATAFTSTGAIQWIAGETTTVAATPAIALYVLDFASTIGDAYWVDNVTFTDEFEPAALTVELGLAANPLDALSTVAWTDVTEYGLQADWGRGRTHERNPIQAGTATVRLDNSDGRFDPMNTTGTYWPNLKPMKRLRITLTKDATVYRQFTGYVDAYKVSRVSEFYSEVEIRATDAFKMLNLLALRDPYEDTILSFSPRAYYRFREDGEAQIVPLKDSSGNNRDASLFNPKRDVEGHTEGFEFIDRADAPGGKAVEFHDTAVAAQPEAEYAGYGLAPDAGITGTGPFSIVFSYERADYNSTFNGALLTQAETHVETDPGDHFRIQDEEWPGGDLGIRLVVWRSGVNLLDAQWLTGRFENGIFIPATRENQELDQVIITRDGSNFEIYLRSGGYPSAVPMYNTATASATPNFTTSKLWMATASAHQYLNGVFYTFPGTLAEVAVIPSKLSSSQVNEIYAVVERWKGNFPGTRIGNVLDQIGWASADRNIETGATPLAAFDDAGESALAHLLDAAASDDGIFFFAGDGKATFFSRHHLITATRSTTTQVIFGDGGDPEVPYEPNVDPVLDEHDLYNDVIVQREGGVPQTATDTSSITSYGRRTLSETGSIAGSDNDTAARAKFLVQQYAQPVGRVRSLTFSELDTTGAITSTYPPALGLELWDRMIYRQRLEGAALWEQDSIVEGLSHSYDARTRKHKVTVSFSSIPATFAEGGYWVLNTSTLDGTAKLAY